MSKMDPKCSWKHEYNREQLEEIPRNWLYNMQKEKILKKFFKDMKNVGYTVWGVKSNLIH